MKTERAKIIVCGAVQGVGLRPFIFRLARELQMSGWVGNSTSGVIIEIEGRRDRLNQFLLRLEKERPPRAIIQSLEFTFLDAAGYEDFEIRASESSGLKTTFVLPDIAPCADCLREIFDPTDLRFLYPFTNCTNCGPRFSIIESLPYDRANTSMKLFEMCPACMTEYHDPGNRRFHAQPNACPVCGPQLECWDQAGKILATRNDALLKAVEMVRDGKILAVKSVGGFQLIVDARNETAVLRLRHCKNREEKPFALLFPTSEMVRSHCLANEFEQRLLRTAEAPIVLVRKRNPSLTSVPEIADAVAPNNPFLGAMLPCSPLHHIMMRQLNFPVVATSGNIGGEPLCIDEHQALQDLSTIADFFLVHDRPIVRPVDDSVARVIFGREQILRRARGYAPLPVTLNGAPSHPPVLAVGAHLKNSVAVAVAEQVFVSQHIGDLEAEPAYTAFRRIIRDLQGLYDISPKVIACDLNPEYLSTKFAQTTGVPLIHVQHHHAHVLACAAENEITLPALGVAWDGTGLGDDGKIWGGEFLRLEKASFCRVAHFREFLLPGGTAAIRQPRRTALGWLWEIFGDDVFNGKIEFPGRHFSASELVMIRKMLDRKINSPLTTSAGRMFDAVASLVGLRQRQSFEGQAAMELEFIVQPDCDDFYPLNYSGGETAIIDWQPMMLGILEDVAARRSPGLISAKFHNAMVAAIVEIAKKTNELKVVLSGGCFQNKYLLERSIVCLEQAGFKAYWHQRVPTNDGGIALGQAVAAINFLKSRELIPAESNHSPPALAK